MVRKLCLWAWALWIGIGCSSQKEDAHSQSVKVPVDEKKENLLKRLKSLEELVQKNPQDAALLAERANVHYLLGDSVRCFQDITQAIQIRPQDADFLYLKGFYAYQYNQIDTALHWLQQSYQTLNQNPDVPFYIGNCYFLRKDYAKALDWYAKSIQKEENPNYYYAVALTYYQQNQNAQVEQNLRKALQKDSLHAKSLSLLAELYLYRYRDYVRANEVIQKLLKQEDLPVGHYLEGSLYFQKALEREDSVEKEGLLRLAIEHYSQAIRKDPYYTTAFYDRGYAFFLLRRYDLATESFEEVLKQNPKDYRAAFLLGSIAEFYEDKPLAKHYYELALKIRPDFSEAQQALQELQ